MDRAAGEYTQSDQASTATYSTQQDPRSGNLSSTNTPQSDYGHRTTTTRQPAYPQDYSRYNQYAHAPQNPGVTMAQQQSPSISLPDDVSKMHAMSSNMNSNQDPPIDPSISQPSPTYPPYSPYGAAPQQDMQQYPQHQAPAYDYNRPPPQQGWGYPPQQPMPGHYHHPGAVGPPPQASAQQRPSQVYSFVPIPGAQQHKRPRRRYEEIERMYKCGWNGCEKAYGTLNHLNAHVTMQSHGSKRTPEEFKEIRKEWKARKKEEENARKAEEEQRHRQAQQQAQQGVEGQGADGHSVPSQPYQQNGGRPSLPPIGGYQQPDQPQQSQYGQQPVGMVYQQGNGNMHYQPNYPNSPYAPQGQGYQNPNQQNHYG